MIRMITGVKMMLIAITSVCNPRPIAVASVSAKSMLGNEIKTSARRLMILSTSPPR